MKEDTKCDSTIWSGACEHPSRDDRGEKYRCDACGTIGRLEHEVSREGFIHIKGDDDSLG